MQTTAEHLIPSMSQVIPSLSVEQETDISTAVDKMVTERTGTHLVRVNLKPYTKRLDQVSAPKM